MKIEVGKTYRTRDGRKAVVTEDDGTDFYPMNVMVGDYSHWHNRDGSHFTGIQGVADLVAEWVEPVAGFSIGDKVRLKSTKEWGDLGVGTVAESHFDVDKIGVIYPGGRFKWHFDADELDLITAAPHIVAVTINGKPAPATKPFIHPSREAAVAEAKRLAALSPGSEFAVYQRVSAVTAEVVIKEAA